MVGEDGGAKAHIPCDASDKWSDHKQSLKRCQARAEALVQVLTQLKHPTLIRDFYALLPQHLNFEALSPEKPNPNLLLTLEDEVEQSLLRFHSIVMVCELLTRLSEQEELMASVFVSVCDAVPMVTALLAATQQRMTNKQDSQDLQQLQEAMLLNIILLLKSLLNSKAQCDRLTSSDWASLRTLLPTLNNLEHSDRDVPYLDEVMHTILTHGAVTELCSKEDMVSAREKWAQENNIRIVNRERANELITELNIASNSSTGNSKLHKNDSDSVKTNKSDNCAIHESKQSEYASQRNYSFKPELDEDDDDDELVENSNRLSVAQGCSTSVYNPMVEPTSEILTAPNLNSITGDNSSETEIAIRTPMQSNMTTGYYPDSINQSLNYNRSMLASSSSNNSIFHFSNKTNSSNKSVSDCRTAMEDLCSPLLPIRGHALLSLSRLLDSRDPETMRHRGKLLALFEHNLKDDDSYIYLTAVEGLVCLCDAFPEKAS